MSPIGVTCCVQADIRITTASTNVVAQVKGSVLHTLLDRGVDAVTTDVPSRDVQALTAH